MFTLLRSVSESGLRSGTGDKGGPRGRVGSSDPLCSRTMVTAPKGLRPAPADSGTKLLSLASY